MIYHFSNLGCNAKTWPDVDNGVICGDCLALVNIGSYRTCHAYCESFNISCRSAFEEIGDSCTTKKERNCDTDFDWTSDALCQCKNKTGNTGITIFIIFEDMNILTIIQYLYIYNV